MINYDKSHSFLPVCKMNFRKKNFFKLVGGIPVWGPGSHLSCCDCYEKFGGGEGGTFPDLLYVTGEIYILSWSS